MDALYDADTALQIHGLGLVGAPLVGKIIDGQSGPARLAQLMQTLPDKGQVHGIGVFVIQGAVGQAGVELRPTEKIIQADHMGVCSLPDQLLGQLVGAGGLAAGRRAGEHDDLGAGKAHLFGGILHAVAVALLAQGGKLLRTAGGNVVQPDFNQTFRTQIVIIKISHSFFALQYLRKALDILCRILEIEDTLHPSAAVGHQLGAAACTGGEDGLDFLHDIDIIVPSGPGLHQPHFSRFCRVFFVAVEVNTG